MTHDLDLLRRQAEEAAARGNPITTDPRVIIAILDTITTLMDEDSILANGQRIAKKAIDDMIKARKERDEARVQARAFLRRIYSPSEVEEIRSTLPDWLVQP